VIVLLYYIECKRSELLSKFRSDQRKGGDVVLCVSDMVVVAQMNVGETKRTQQRSPFYKVVKRSTRSGTRRSRCLRCCLHRCRCRDMQCIREDVKENRYNATPSSILSSRPTPSD
jgi:hypothetical protein